MGHLHRWDGSKWVDTGIGSRFKRWNGSSYANVPVKRWNGSSWVNIAEQEYTTTWTAKWSRSYWDGGQYKGDYYGGHKLYQGRYGAPDIYTRGEYGLQQSLCGFDYANIKSTLSGAKIKKVEIWLKNEHFWYWAGGYAHIGAHNENSAPSKFKYSHYGLATQYYSGRGGSHWIQMPNSFAEYLRDGKAKGFTLHHKTNNLSYYGYWTGAHQGSNAPKLKITYTK